MENEAVEVLVRSLYQVPSNTKVTADYQGLDNLGFYVFEVYWDKFKTRIKINHGIKVCATT